MKCCHPWALLLLAALNLASPVSAQSPRQGAVPYQSKVAYEDIVVDGSGRATITYTSVTQINHESALENLKVSSFSYSSSIQTGEVLDAYTLKKDGRKLPVPANNYQTKINKGRDSASAVFSDWTSVSVVFPDVAVGDSVALTYRVSDQEAMFPGHFSVSRGFSPYRVYEDARITIQAPTSLKLHLESHGLTTVPASEEGSQRTYQWTYKRMTPAQWNEADQGIWRLDESPSLLASTFNTYEDIAKAYGDRALEKAKPTPRVQALAQEIVGQEAKSVEKARMLYEWVAKNITYGGNCIGIGAVVPRDLDFVLDNKMGDCKDHATLLQALLHSQGIASEQVLINSGGLYDLPSTPVVSLVNHVMNYIPEFKLYLDSTATDIPFGYLPSGSYAKPVIHVGNANALATTPNLQSLQSQQRLNMKFKMLANGGASGELRLEVKGLAAAAMQAYMRGLTDDAEADFVKHALAGYGLQGTGSLDKGDTSKLSDQYSFSMRFTIDHLLDGGASGAFYLAPVIETPLPVMRYASIKGRVEPSRRHSCLGFHSYETLEIELPPGMKLVSVPPNAKVRSKLVDYTATYKQAKNVLTSNREIHDKTEQNICTAEEAAELHKSAMPIADNLRTQVLYRRKG